MGRIMGWLAVWLVHVGLWLIYVSQIKTWETLVGAAAAGLATLGVAVFRRLGLVKFSMSFRQIAEARHLPWLILSGTWKILQGTWQQLFSKRGASSHLAAVPFDVGQADPACAGRRALAVLYMTMTPNTVVVGIVREQGLLLYHQIVRGGASRIAKNLGARP